MVRDLLQQIVDVRQQRLERIAALEPNGSVSESSVEQAQLDLLAAQLELARYDEGHTPSDLRCPVTIKGERCHLIAGHSGEHLT